MKYSQQFAFNQVSSLCYACAQIFKSKSEQVLGRQVAEVLAANGLQNINSLTNIELINFMMSFLMVRLTNQSILLEFSKKIVSEKHTFRNEEINKILFVLTELEFSNKAVFDELFAQVIENIQPDSTGKAPQSMLVDTACGLIFTLSQTTKNTLHANELFSFIHQQY